MVEMSMIACLLKPRSWKYKIENEPFAGKKAFAIVHLRRLLHLLHRLKGWAASIVCILKSVWSNWEYVRINLQLPYFGSGVGPNCWKRYILRPVIAAARIRMISMARYTWWRWWGSTSKRWSMIVISKPAAMAIGETLSFDVSIKYVMAPLSSWNWQW